LRVLASTSQTRENGDVEPSNSPTDAALFSAPRSKVVDKSAARATSRSVGAKERDELYVCTYYYVHILLLCRFSDVFSTIFSDISFNFLVLKCPR
jgi:hypothetical protein